VTEAVLITGAAGGIGRALCEAFDAAGYFVVATDKATDAKTSFAYISCDLERLPNEAASQSAFLEQLQGLVGNRPLKACVHNAAVQVLGSVSDVTDQDFLRTLHVNLAAPFVLTRLLLPQLRASRGAVVNIGSVHARATKPGFVAYATSKAALLGLTQAMAVDLGPDVRVNIIQPGAVATDMLLAGFEGHPGALEKLKAYHPIGEIGEPADVANLAVFLVSDQAKFMSGAAVPIDGAIGVRLHDPD
jgi:NAD(P)-dependent dehydrogenase (short-subunit alcohol dehydrogenase family)